MLYKMSQLFYKQNHLLKKVKKVSRYVKKWKNDYDIYMFTFTQYYFHFELKSCIGFIFSQLREKFWEDLWIVVDKYIYKILKNLKKNTNITYQKDVLLFLFIGNLYIFSFEHIVLNSQYLRTDSENNRSVWLWHIMTLPIKTITSILEVSTYIITALSMRLATMLVLKSVSTFKIDVILNI